jgi:hypothetical protein
VVRDLHRSFKWIDTICIRQKDIPERNSQVRHMNSIYKKASEVVAWVGEEAEDSNLAFDAFEALPKDDSTHWTQAVHLVPHDFLSGPKYIRAIQLFFQRPWWNRVWTVQESVLPHTPNFVCGNRHISTDKPFAVWRWCSNHSSSCCREMLGEFGTRTSNAFYSLNQLSDSCADVENGIEIEGLLNDYRSRHCIDPRDKIYGLLGIARSEDAKLIVPNYSTPVSETYEEVALKIIEHTETLRLFSQLYPQSEAGTTATKLPSWVPDWTSSYNFPQFQALGIRFEMTGFYKASARSSARVRSIKQGKIALRGILYSGCAIFSEPNSFERVYDSFSVAGITTHPNRLYTNSSSTTY